MSRRLPLILLLIALPLWLAASYAARYGFMRMGSGLASVLMRPVAGNARCVRTWV